MVKGVLNDKRKGVGSAINLLLEALLKSSLNAELFDFYLSPIESTRELT